MAAGLVLAANGLPQAFAQSYTGYISTNSGGVTGTSVINLSNGSSTNALSYVGNFAGYQLTNTGLPASPSNITWVFAGLGGAIYATGTTALTGNPIILSENRAGSNGGALWSAQAITLSGALTAASNVAGALRPTNVVQGGSGGAIFVSNTNNGVTQSGGDVRMTNNIATQNGGAISAYGVSLGTDASHTITLQGNFAGYRLADATQLPSSSNLASGAAIGGGGGAISSAGPVLLTGSEIVLSDNWATGNGGGIYMTAVSTLAITGKLTAERNRAAGNGGALVITASNGGVTLAGGDVVMASNQVTAGGRGGAIYNSGPVSIAGDSGSTTLTGNIAAAGAGAIYASNLSLGNAAGTVDIENNYAGYTLVDATQPASPANVNVTPYTTSANGGALSVIGTVTLQGSQITLSGNRATNNGGAVYSLNNFPVTITGDLHVDGNVAVGGVGGAIANAGGGSASTVSMTGALIGGNNLAGSYGGVIYAPANVAQDKGAVDLENNYAGYALTDFTQTASNSNVAAIPANSSHGGAIASGGGIVSLATTSGSVTLANNWATGSGGAVYATGNVVMGGNTNTAGVLSLRGNKAGIRGGAIYSGNAVTLFGTAISNNTATSDGGAVYAARGFTLTTTTADTISANTAGGFGGAIWTGGDATLNAVKGGIRFSGNTQQSSAATPQANAIYLNSASKLTLNAAGYPITFFDPIQNNAANPVTVEAMGGDTVTFDGAQYATAANRWSQIYGGTTVDAGAAFAVQNNAVYGELAADAGNTAPSSFTVQPNATLVGGGADATNGWQGSVRADTFTLGGTLNVAGAADDGTHFSTFTVVSGQADLSGGAVRLNTCLDAGGSANASATRSDVLTLDGSPYASQRTASGPATIQITHLGPSADCLGAAATTGDGILLVRALNTDTTDVFTLAASADPAIAISGNQLTINEVTYQLLRGSVSDIVTPASANPATVNNWYLRYLKSGSTKGDGATTPVPALNALMLAVLALLMMGATVMRAARRQ